MASIFFKILPKIELMSSFDYSKFHSLLADASLLSLTKSPRTMIVACETYVTSVSAGQWIFQEGESADHLIIPLDCELELLVNNDGEQIGAGRLLPGRAAQLYSLLKNEAFHCSGRSRTDGHCLKIPSVIAQEWFTNDRELHLHLERMVSSLEYRSLSKQIQQIGVNSRFLVEFLGKLTEHKLPPQQWLAQEGQPPQSCFYLTRGSLQVLRIDEAKNYRNLWNCPEKSWALFNECENQVNSRYSYKSIDEIHFFRMNETALTEIKSIWEDDFAHFKVWLKAQQEENAIDFELPEESNSIQEKRFQTPSPEASVISPPEFRPLETLPPTLPPPPGAKKVAPSSENAESKERIVSAPQKTLTEVASSPMSATAKDQLETEPNVKKATHKEVSPPMAEASTKLGPVKMQPPTNMVLPDKPFIESKKRVEKAAIAKPTPPAPAYVRGTNSHSLGPRCLSLLSSHFKMSQSLETWEQQLRFLDDDQTNLVALAKVLEANSFVTKIIKIDSLKDFDSTRLPCLVLRQGYPMILFKIDNKNVAVGDPNLGLVDMPKREFEASIEKVALLAFPKPPFLKPEGTTFGDSELKFLKNKMKNWFNLASGLALAAAILSLFTPLFGQVFVDEILQKKDVLTGLTITACFLLLISIQKGVELVHLKIVNIMSDHLALELKSYFLTKILSLPFEFIPNYAKASTSKYLEKIEVLSRWSTTNNLETIKNFSAFSLLLIATAFYNYLVAGLLIAYSVMYFLAHKIFTKKFKNLKGNSLESKKLMTEMQFSFLQKLFSIKLLAHSLEAKWQLESGLTKDTLTQEQLRILQQNFTTGFAFMNRLALGAIFAFISLATLRDPLSLGQTLALCGFSWMFSATLSELSQQWLKRIEIDFTIASLNELFLLPSETGFEAKAPSSARLLGEVEFKNVWFRYGGEHTEWAIRNLNFKIEPGQKVSFMGPSAGGKTTIALLLARVIEPTQGQIFLDGHPLTSYDPQWLRTHFGFYSGNSHFTKGTIAENISDQQFSIDTEKIEESSFYANLENDLRKRKQSIDLAIDASAHTLSSGERQKIQLARIFYQKADALLLDECTTNLDPISEFEFFQHLKNQFPLSTVIHLTPKFSNSKNWDLIFVIEEGRVIDQGTHEELLAVSTAYKKMLSHSVRLKREKGAA